MTVRITVVKVLVLVEVTSKEHENIMFRYSDQSTPQYIVCFGFLICMRGDVPDSLKLKMVYYLCYDTGH